MGGMQLDKSMKGAMAEHVQVELEEVRKKNEEPSWDFVNIETRKEKEWTKRRTQGWRWMSVKASTYWPRSCRRRCTGSSGRTEATLRSKRPMRAPRRPSWPGRGA